MQRLGEFKNLSKNLKKKQFPNFRHYSPKSLSFASLSQYLEFVNKETVQSMKSYSHSIHFFIFSWQRIEPFLNEFETFCCIFLCQSLEDLLDKIARVVSCETEMNSFDLLSEN